LFLEYLRDQLPNVGSVRDDEVLHEDWNIYKDILLRGVDDEHLLTLRDNNVFEEDYAYGHETRHVAARRWFLEHFPARTKKEASALMFGLACYVDSIEPSTWPFVRVLLWLGSGVKARFFIDLQPEHVRNARSVRSRPGGTSLRQSRRGRDLQNRLKIRKRLANCIYQN
jgi:hypothetical protein